MQAMPQTQLVVLMLHTKHNVSVIVCQDRPQIAGIFEPKFVISRHSPSHTVKPAVSDHLLLTTLFPCTDSSTQTLWDLVLRTTCL